MYQVASQVNMAAKGSKIFSIPFRVKFVPGDWFVDITDLLLPSAIATLGKK